MELRAADITIAITVFSRREFVIEAIHSALNQTIPVKVIVVEDCGPDPAIRDFIVNEFGNRIEYFRNEKNRGLFDNWNACMEYSRTPWLSMLHDDDLLRPNFIETMLALSKQAPGRGLYFGWHGEMKKADGKWEEFYYAPPPTWNWRDIDVSEFAEAWSSLGFVGHLFNIANAQSIGGVRKNSYYTGDWDFWFRLAVHFGGAVTSVDVGVGRSHEGPERGTTPVWRKGWPWLLGNVQRKRNLLCLRRQRGIAVPFERAKLLAKEPIPSRILFRFGRNFTRRVLFYNWWLFTHSKPPHWRYAVLQWLARLFGADFVRIASILTNEKTH